MYDSPSNRAMAAWDLVLLPSADLFFILYRSLPSLREYVLIDPADRRVEVFTLADAAAQRWTMVDQSKAGELVLSSIDLVLQMAVVFRGVGQAA